MKVYITGASGFVGRSLVTRLLEHGHEVTACVRAPDRADGLGIAKTSVVPDIGPDTDWGHELDGHDAIVHLAARVHVMEDHELDPLAAFRQVNVGGLDALAQAAIRSNINRFITLSSVKAIGEETAPGRAFDETMRDRPQDPYGKSKLEADIALRQHAKSSGMGWTILRPPLVYGPGVGGNFLTLLNACAARRVMPVGGVRNQRSMIYLGNLVDALCTAIEAKTPINGAFLVDDGVPVSTPELIRLVSDALCVRPRILPIPAWFLRFGLTAIGRRAMADRLMGSLVVNNGLFQRAAGWTPPYKMVQGLAETAAWYRRRDGL